MSTKHTPGPWRWEFNERSKSLQLVGGRPQFDLTIIQPTRWGMSSATLYIRDTSHDGMNLLHKLHERRDWTAPFKGRAHHADWCKDVVHPDMRLIAAAPRLLKAALIFEEYCEAMATGDDRAAMLKYAAAQTERRAAIAKATGEQA